MEPDNTAVATHLGQKSEYKDQYDPSLLVREPRASNREHLNISDDDPPFVGADVWNAYECSALTDSSMPVNSVAKIVYPATNKWIVESKSLKLYLNSFNMTKLGEDAITVLDQMEGMIAKDLSALLETNVEVRLFEAIHDTHDRPSQYFKDKYVTLEHQFHVPCEHFVETPSLLDSEPVLYRNVTTCHYHSALLKSNCRVTHQPDWGDVFITMEGLNMPNPQQLLKYIISFRGENHFHEEICETMYKRLKDQFSLNELAVTCLYVRRGGIDINPVRASHEHLLNKALIDPDRRVLKTMRQ